MPTSDPLLGRVFEDLDPRSVGRRIKIIAHRRSLLGEGYRALRINSQGDAVAGGRPLNLTREQLERDYRPEVPLAVDVKAGVDELRKAAGSIRELVRRLRHAKHRGNIAGREELIALHKAMGFSRTEQALAVAAVLEEASDEAWLHQQAPSELILVVARIVNRAAL